MIPFKNLSAKENRLLLNFPAYISMLALSYDDKLDFDKKMSVLKTGHIKNYFSDPMLSEFYKEADLVFQSNIERFNKNLPREKDRREAAIIKELSSLEKIVLKLEKELSATMNRSMKSFKNHVSKACHDVLLDFVFPVQTCLFEERL